MYVCLKLTFPTAYSTAKSESRNRKMPGNSGNGSRHNRFNLYNNAMPRRLTDSSGRQMMMFQRRFNSSMLTKTCHIHHHQYISSITAAPARSECARRRRIFHAAITFATQTNVKRKKNTMKIFFSID